MKKRFLVTTVAGCAFFAWLLKTVVGGALYATAAFFTRRAWEIWASRRKFWG